MRSHRKPDLLFILTVFVGLGILVSSYIQYSRANPTLSDSAAPSAKLDVSSPAKTDNPLVLVANPVHTEQQFLVDSMMDNGVVVINSPNQQ